MNWQFFVLVCVVSTSVSALFQKKLVTKKEINPFVFAAFFQLLISLIIGVVLIFKGFHLPPLGPIAINFALMPIFYGLGNIAKFKSLKEIEASEFTVIYQASTLITVAIAVLLLKETFVAKQVFGLLLVITAIILVTIKDKIMFNLSKGEIWGLITAALYGIAFVNDAYVLRSFDLWTYTFLAFFLPGIFSLMVGYREIHGIRTLFERDNFKNFFFSSFFYALGALAIYSAYQAGRNAAQISSINQTSTILIVILAAVFLKERDRIPKKLIAAVISVAGVILLK